MNFELKYDVFTEVSTKQYGRIMNELKGVCAGRVDDGKYFIKIWLLKWRTNVLWILETEK